MMTRMHMIISAFAIALVGSIPAFAQMEGGSMKSGAMMADHGNMKITKSQITTMKKCHGIAHRVMMKNTKCASMMKMHSDMMK